MVTYYVETFNPHAPTFRDGFKETMFSNLERAKQYARGYPDGTQVTIRKAQGYEYVETHIGVMRRRSDRTIGRYHVMSHKLISDVKKKKSKPAPFGL